MAKQFHTDTNANLIHDDTVEIMIKQESELSSLLTVNPNLPIGSIAYTPGFKKLWQLNQSKEWIQL